jgi:hypothetical protein
MSSVPNPQTPEQILRAGITKALEHLANKRPGRATYTLTRALMQANKAALRG